ncbi:uncharacterized protein LOC120789144 isoform X2 [Xiphias gladius]|uniref:uncharacterized protein LOC120789144 isoform X2 n=1 Tax=Xiphias gladius TaxID=8245 RepID=UPI001A99D0A7|nr:uncharacterized protein LOC120789144 isoform X2 [Xiphias gladius]
MMAEFRWIKPSLFLVLVLRFAVAAAGQNTLRFNVRVGGEAAITGKPTTTIKITRTKVMTSEATNDAGSINNNSPQGCWWWYIIVSVVLAALIISIVLIIWKKTIGNKTQTEEDMADPDGGVSYATISYARKTDREARVQGDAVIYSTVEAPSSSAGASTAPSSIYATVNKPNK